MRYYKQLINNLVKHKLIKSSLDELQRRNIYQLMQSMSDRVDKLEDFISDETKYDGDKVHQAKFGNDRKAWLK